MSRWSDLIPRQESTVNESPGAMGSIHGVCLHTADGYYEGTLSWQQNPDSLVSSHFIIGKDEGQWMQVVDTSSKAWCEASGNTHWLSVENAGWGDKGDPLTAWQIEANAQILARAHLTYGVPIVSTSNVDASGLIHHSAGGYPWGGHFDCPGATIIGQKQDIIIRALTIVGAVPLVPPAPLIIDGILGPKTITRWQQEMGTPVDGVISVPSPLVSAVQRFLNFKLNANLAVDGLGIFQDNRAYHTVAALQRYLGTPIDGILSLPTSLCVKALQSRLNSGHF